MSSSDQEPVHGISDEDLPDDLQPTDDNPLAQSNDDDVDPDELDLGAHDADPDDEQHED